MFVRAGLWFLAVVDAAVGLGAVACPRAFYDHVPWVAANPPYSEHLLRDYGAMNLAVALMLAVAANTMDRTLVPTVLAGQLVFAVLHLVFHATHLHRSGAAAAAELAAFSIAAALPAALLALARHAHRR